MSAFLTFILELTPMDHAAHAIMFEGRVFELVRAPMSDADEPIKTSLSRLPEGEILYDAIVNAQNNRIVTTSSPHKFPSLPVRIVVWDTETGLTVWKEIQHPSAGDPKPVYPSFSPEGTYLAVFDGIDSISILNTQSFESLGQVKVPRTNKYTALLEAVAIFDPLTVAVISVDTRLMCDTVTKHSVQTTKATNANLVTIWLPTTRFNGCLRCCFGMDGQTLWLVKWQNDQFFIASYSVCGGYKKLISFMDEHPHLSSEPRFPCLGTIPISGQGDCFVLSWSSSFGRESEPWSRTVVVSSKGEELFRKHARGDPSWGRRRVICCVARRKLLTCMWIGPKLKLYELDNGGLRFVERGEIVNAPAMWTEEVAVMAVARQQLTWITKSARCRYTDISRPK